MRLLALLITIGWTAAGCVSGTYHRKYEIKERPTMVHVALPGLAPAFSSLTISAGPHALARQAASVIEQRLPIERESGRALKIELELEQLQRYQRPVAGDKLQFTCRLRFGLRAQLNGQPWRYFSRAKTHTEHLPQGSLTLEAWAAKTGPRLTRLLAEQLATSLVSGQKSQLLPFLGDSSAPVERGIDQASRGDLAGAATTFELAARNALRDRDVPLYDLALVREAQGQWRSAFALFEQAWLLTRDERYLAAMGRIRNLERSQ